MTEEELIEKNVHLLTLLRSQLEQQLAITIDALDTLKEIKS